MYKSILFITLVLLANVSHGYSNEFGHNRLALIAYHFLNQCEGESVSQSYALKDIDLITGGSTSVDTSVLPFSTYNRLFDWHFYKAHKDSETGDLSLVDTPWLLFNGTFKKPWNKLLKKYTNTDNKEDKLKWLGGFAHFIEDMANPAHIIPAFHMVGVKDGIDDFRSSYYNKLPSELDFTPALNTQPHPCTVFRGRYEELAHDSASLTGATSVFNHIRDALVAVTRNELNQTIDHCPDFTWADFYSEPNHDAFFGDFNTLQIKTDSRHGEALTHISEKKVMIGFEGTIVSSGKLSQSCDFTRSLYQPFIDRLFLNAIIADAMLLKSQADEFSINEN